MRQRLDVIRRERKNVNRAAHSGWRSRENVGVGREIGAERVRLHLNPVLRHRCSGQDAKRAPIENSVAPAHGGAALLIQLVCKSKTWGPIVFVRIDPARVDSDRCQTSIRVLYLWLRITVQVISYAVFRLKTKIDPPGILNVESSLVCVWLSERSICSSTGESLRERPWSPSGKVRIAVALKGPAEVAGKEILDPSNIQIESELIGMGAALMGQTFYKLVGLAVRIARANRIPSDLHHECPVLRNLRLRHAGDVRRTGLVVARPAELGLEHGCGIDDVRIVDSDVVGGDVGVSRVLQGAVRSGAFKIHTVKAARIVAKTQLLACSQ